MFNVHQSMHLYGRIQNVNILFERIISAKIDQFSHWEIEYMKFFKNVRKVKKEEIKDIVKILFNGGR